ncbi:hypothetical protein G3T14_06765 [Methylobacterium sp. BTF04]|nr:hypothetical protein [Methylobacterium sp. BTF04]
MIDLKAKRLPDPVSASKPSATGAGLTPGVSIKTPDGKPAESKPSDVKGTDGKPADTKPADTKAGEARTVPGAIDPGKASGTTAPRIGPTPVAAVPPAARGPGFGSLATAGLLGGVIGAGLLFGVQRAGILPPQDDARLTALDQRIAALAPRDALSGLDKRVSANEAALKAVPEAVATAKEALQKASAAPAPAPADGSAAPSTSAPTIPADLVARLDSLDQRVSALQEEPGQQGGEARMAIAPAGGDAAQVSALAVRLKTLEGKLDSAPKAEPDLAPKLAALQSDVDARVKANAQAAEAVGQKLTTVQQSLEAQVKAATEAVQTATNASQQAVDANKTQAAEAAKTVERQLKAQSDKIAGLDKAVSERAETSTVQAALRVVSADRIVTALANGAPYADALASLRGLEPGDPARLTAVAVFADKGAPTGRSLAAEFRPIAEKIAAARRAAQTRSVAENGDLSQKLMSMAESIVQVRKVDAPAASATASAATDPLPAIQASLESGDIQGAAQAFAGLPEDVRAQTGEFGTKLKSRAAAGVAAQGLLADAFKAIPASGPSR